MKIQPLSSAEFDSLKSFLESDSRPEDTFSIHELQGFLFAIATSPETIPPSEWLLMITGEQDIGFAGHDEAEQILGLTMRLYNEVNAAVLERSSALPTGVGLEQDVMANFEPSSPVAAWARGFATGYDWLAEVWDEYRPDDDDEDFGTALMTLLFFGSREMAEAFYRETVPDPEPADRFEAFAQGYRDLFPCALAAFAEYGRGLFEAAYSAAEPVRSNKTGRNEPCPCGSGKKYKKCCLMKVH